MTLHTTGQQPDQRPVLPIHDLVQGQLYRAIVSLPEALCPPGQPLHERIVFFETPHRQSKAAAHLQALLTLAWGQDTSAWVEHGQIYGIETAAELQDTGLSAHPEARLFEMGTDSENRIRYADPARIDLYTTAPVQTRLRARLIGLRAGKDKTKTQP
ncbi:hypothetical protein D8B23_18740 [Verminephrobacter aporrectodeae subsp. tuberculatae]|uniref:Uncharacterized protein n=1 Tax=Verminephrobacter aporrectodeae subsp. tuberculatae TaxID=1110392 RepID=A0ABT3KSZ0_9BURK|nr:hypothetical protein [Verminephrobacter aporrectodeae]MCW5257374.1 hypothetical protein [Verminephrobacter aporrectodeae subsp. tuberculatae]MCW5321441.1 hypothetical protein [Verminephrobacter aporrectodeae subsp. tuberculatae]MCW8200382.1 hypothetical protein [Verminephrobacter aporrectodeae subsp. tuberculatae]